LWLPREAPHHATARRTGRELVKERKSE
jgi:hypothetical protein